MKYIGDHSPHAPVKSAAVAIIELQTVRTLNAVYTLHRLNIHGSCSGAVIMTSYRTTGIPMNECSAYGVVDQNGGKSEEAHVYEEIEMWEAEAHINFMNSHNN